MGNEQFHAIVEGEKNRVCVGVIRVNKFSFLNKAGVDFDLFDIDDLVFYTIVRQWQVCQLNRRAHTRTHSQEEKAGLSDFRSCSKCLCASWSVGVSFVLMLKW